MKPSDGGRGQEYRWRSWWVRIFGVNVSITIHEEINGKWTADVTSLLWAAMAAEAAYHDALSPFVEAWRRMHREAA